MPAIPHEKVKIVIKTYLAYLLTSCAAQTCAALDDEPNRAATQCSSYVALGCMSAMQVTRTVEIYGYSPNVALSAAGLRVRCNIYAATNGTSDLVINHAIVHNWQPNPADADPSLVITSRSATAASRRPSGSPSLLCVTATQHPQLVPFSRRHLAAKAIMQETLGDLHGIIPFISRVGSQKFPALES